jgi:hypothetical protein
MVFKLNMKCGSEGLCGVTQLNLSAIYAESSMTTVFNQIHRLKRQPGWTWDHFLSEIDRLHKGGMDEKTLYSHYRQPHKKPTTHVTRLINQLHTQYFPDPFPEEINRLMSLYNNLIRCKKHLTLDKDIEDLQFFLCQQLKRENEQDLLRIARISWLLGNIHFDRIPTMRDNGLHLELNKTKQKAIDYYQTSVSAIEKYNQHNREPVGASHLYKARHNILACYLNAVVQEQRSCDSDVLQYLRQSNYIPNSKITLQAEPFQWSIARNGLRFSSLLQNQQDVQYFFNALISVSDKFSNLDYQPLNYSSISAGADFKWAIMNVLTLKQIK